MRLEDYKIDNPEIKYLVGAEVPLDDKITLLYQFLTPYHDRPNCTSMHSKEEVDTESGQEAVFSFFINDPDTDHAPKMVIRTVDDAIHREVESSALEQAWIDILELRVDLHERWDGSGYHISKKRSLNAKLKLLDQFLTEHAGSEFSIEPGSSENKTMKVVADPTGDKVRLLIEYSDYWLHETYKLLEVLTNRLQPPPPASPWEKL